MEDIILIGGGGHCCSVIDVIEQEKRFNIIGIIDKPELIGTQVLNYDVIAADSDLPKLAEKIHYALITVGQIKSAELRIQLFQQVRDYGFQLPVIISPRAYVSDYAAIGDGTVICHDALINANVSIAENCIINTKALVEHDCVIRAHCHISTGAVINGGVTINERSFIGSHATVVNQLYLKADSFVKAGSLVKSARD